LLLFRGLRILRLAVRKMAVCTLLASLSLLSAACGPRITNANLDVVENERLTREPQGRGISPKEVESILGQPTKSETTKLPLETQKKEVEVIRYYYVQDGEELVLHFVDGKLISSVPKLGALPQSPVGNTKPAGTATPAPDGK
jgi:hypothetical protein